MTESEKIEKLLQDRENLSIFILFKKLQEAGIPCEFNDRSTPDDGYGGTFRYQICYPDIEHQKADVLQAYLISARFMNIPDAYTSMSYGAEDNLMEAYGFDELPDGDVRGWLDVDAAFEMFKNEYYGLNRREKKDADFTLWNGD